MLTHDSNLNFLRYAFNHILDQLEQQQQQLAEIKKDQEMFANQLDEHENRLGSAESNISHLTHQVDRNAELEFMENPYSLDGSPQCNY